LDRADEEIRLVGGFLRVESRYGSPDYDPEHVKKTGQIAK
jgi:hypothetical protein